MKIYEKIFLLRVLLEKMDYQVIQAREENQWVSFNFSNATQKI